MIFDIFLSICQTEVDGRMPSERVMFQNFFDQVRLADELGFGCAWVAETHLSCQIQKRNPGAVIPNFKGEIGLNTDILQVAHLVFSQTKRIHVGSAIRNILCNGGPMAHAEAIRTFLTLHSLRPNENRLLEFGFASGRFPFSNTPYGIRPRTETEMAAWPALRGLIFQQATEIFLRFLRGDVFASRDVRPIRLTPDLFRTSADWQKVTDTYAREYGHKQNSIEKIETPDFWVFDDVGVIPFEAPLELLRLTIGAHDAVSQHYANKFMPVGVFNLSITPGPVIEQTHERMKQHFHTDGGGWTRTRMPRTVLVFIDDTPGASDEARGALARSNANVALENYWKAVEGTLDPEKVRNAVDNALAGSPREIIQQMRERFHPEDRLMLWFDFNNHDNNAVQKSMRAFMEKVAPVVGRGMSHV